MHASLEAAANALKALSELVKNGWSDDRTLMEAFGWNCPALTRHDLARIPLDLADQLLVNGADSIDAAMVAVLDGIAPRLQIYQNNGFAYLYNGNAAQAAPAYLTMMTAITQSLIPLFQWETVRDPKAMPAAMRNRLRNIQATIDQIVVDEEGLTQKLKLIDKAFLSAESLPAHLEDLESARAKMSNAATDAEVIGKRLSGLQAEASLAVKGIKDSGFEAEQLVVQCGEAYRITTTKGLAASFDQRAVYLANSMWLWVIGLISALAIGGYIGTQRITLLSSALNAADPKLSIIWMHIVLSVLSIGGPLWFAWLATKQVGQRFRLSEDYGFKASVAKAYEGYRREAARIDPEFEARLFSSALARLDEAPLRLVETAAHGSPVHELAQSRAVSNLVQIARDKISGSGKAKGAQALSEAPSQAGE